jgi:hypothetical protein
LFELEKNLLDYNIPLVRTQIEYEDTVYDGKKAKKKDSNPYRINCSLRDELPPLLGIHSRKEYLSGL